MDMAHHSLISSQEASSNNNTDIGDDLTENQRRQLNQQTKEILNVNNLRGYMALGPISFNLD